MKKAIVPMLLAMLVFAGATMAQNSKIETGVIHYNQQEFAKAIKALDVGLSDLSVLKDKNKPRGYYYRAKARMGWMQQVARSGKAEENAEKMETVLLDTYEDFKMAKQYDDGKWGKKIDAEFKTLGVAILQGGLMLVNGTYDAEVPEADKPKMYQEAIKYMNIAAEINPKDHMAYDLRGQAYMSLKDSSNAHKDFATAIKNYEAALPKRPDQLIAYTYYRKALIERYRDNNVDAALASIDGGKAMLDKEHGRLAENKDNYPAEAWAKIEEQYKNAKNDLARFELDLLLNSPGKLQEAINKFEKATQNEPDNYIVHVAYAQLLEKVDKDKAAVIYDKATKIDPKEHIAWFNLGAMYVNQGVELYKQANETEDMEKAKQLQEEADAIYGKAFPYLQQAVEIEQCDKETLTAIMNICINLSAKEDKYMAEYKKYKGIKEGCN